MGGVDAYNLDATLYNSDLREAPPVGIVPQAFMHLQRMAKGRLN